MAGGQQLIDLFSDCLAHTRDIQQLAFTLHGLHIRAQVANAVGSFTVSQGLIDDLALDLRKIGDAVKNGGNFFVIHEDIIHSQQSADFK